jgi:hypothetical protein
MWGLLLLHSAFLETLLEIRNYVGGASSSDIAFIPNFVKTSLLVQNLKWRACTHTDRMVKYGLKHKCYCMLENNLLSAINSKDKTL